MCKGSFSPSQAPCTAVLQLKKPLFPSTLTPSLCSWHPQVKVNAHQDQELIIAPLETLISPGEQLEMGPGEERKRLSRERAHLALREKRDGLTWAGLPTARALSPGTLHVFLSWSSSWLLCYGLCVPGFLSHQVPILPDRLSDFWKSLQKTLQLHNVFGPQSVSSTWMQGNEWERTTMINK